jgi:hypothetical protein
MVYRIDVSRAELIPVLLWFVGLAWVLTRVLQALRRRRSSRTPPQPSSQGSAYELFAISLAILFASPFMYLEQYRYRLRSNFSINFDDIDLVCVEVRPLAGKYVRVEQAVDKGAAAAFHDLLTQAPRDMVSAEHATVARYLVRFRARSGEEWLPERFVVLPSTSRRPEANLIILSVADSRGSNSGFGVQTVRSSELSSLVVAMTRASDPTPQAE